VHTAGFRKRRGRDWGTLLAETRLPGDAEAFAGRGGDLFQSLAGRAGRDDWRERLIHVDLDDLFAVAKLKRTSELQQTMNRRFHLINRSS
jgi:hypothetical protein